MRTSIVTKEVVRRFLVVSSVEQAEIDRICDGLLFDLPVTDVLDEIAAVVDDVVDEADAMERLTLCAAAECLMRIARTRAGGARATKALEDRAGALLWHAGIRLARWEEASSA